MNLYIFGSYVRGEFDEASDVDFLIIKGITEHRHYDLNKFSVYEESRIKDLYDEGNPFAWHLHYESKLVFSSDGKDFLLDLGQPNLYSNMQSDLIKFEKLFYSALDSLILDSSSRIFDLGTIFLSIRNFSTCFSLGYLNEVNFSRDSCLKLGNFSLKVSKENYNLMKRCRILSTRGIGFNITKKEFDNFVNEIPAIKNWFQTIKHEIQ